jgi:uncharacterized protein (DUF4415 family)
MTGNKPSTEPAWTDPDDAPEWSDEVLARAELRDGEAVLEPARGSLTRRGRPRLAAPKRQVTLRLDSDVIERFRQDGPGWQSRINAILRRAAGI